VTVDRLASVHVRVRAPNGAHAVTEGRIIIYQKEQLKWSETRGGCAMSMGDDTGHMGEHRHCLGPMGRTELFAR
jgi:hypothetical protein